MTTFVGASQSPRHGQYEINGQKYPRVSTILGVISKPGLVDWKMRVGIEEANRISREAADLGTAIHAACEAASKGGRLSDCPATYRPFVTAYCAWLATHADEVIATEYVVHHGRHRYAGTVDGIVQLRDGRRALLDLKTGRSLDATYRLQTAAYMDALTEMGEPIDVRMVLHLPSSENGRLYVMEYDEDEKDLRCWRACLRLWRWTSRRSQDFRRVKGLEFIPRDD